MTKCTASNERVTSWAAERKLEMQFSSHPLCEPPH